jgi:hypothetical protein
VRAVLGAALCCLLACGSKSDSTAPASPVRMRGAYPDNAAQPNQPAPAPTAPAVAQAPQPVQAPEPQPDKPAEAPEKRDYSAELLSAVGSPVDCLKPRDSADAPPEIRIDLEAHVLDTGSISRGYARSSQLERQELDCVRTRLEGAHLRGPIEEAPRTVSSTLSIKLKNAAKSAE